MLPDYSIEEAAALMQTSEETVRRWVSKKLIGAYQLGRGWRIAADEVAHIVAARQERDQETIGTGQLSGMRALIAR
ncbi:MAG: helix-turn-helix domain-containing protein [Herpetosiphonaceae bacterium]|nr:helix-turn-helix domain-containing protein [Herpetosiphonaceae bacterium]